MTERVRVFPCNETVRKHIKHPIGNVGFSEGQDSAEWPNDSFTARRLRDGDVTLQEEAPSDK